MTLVHSRTKNKSKASVAADETAKSLLQLLAYLVGYVVHDFIQEGGIGEAVEFEHGRNIWERGPAHTQ